VAEWSKDLADKRILSIGDSFAERLREVRERKLWRQKDLARRLNELGFPLDRVAISKIESKQRSVKIDELAAIAFALDVSPNHLLTSYDQEARIRVTGMARPVVPGVARRWIAGYWTLPGQEDDKFFERERPPEEILTEQLLRERDKEEEQ
jgi:transcriptional regulator with XRE-family HTH domain